MDTFLGVVTEQFNNREIAIIFWVIVALVWLLYYKKTRKEIPRLIKALMNKKILTMLLFMTLYVSGLIVGLERVGLWNVSSHLKDTVVWALTVAFVMFLNVNNISKEEKNFRKILKDYVKLALVLEFIVGFYPFALLIELLLIPCMVFLGAFQAVAGMKEESAPVKKLITGVIGIIGFVLIWHSVAALLADINAFFSIERLIEFILPSLLTILFLPFIYFLALFMLYEQLFMRFDFQNRHSDLTSYAKRQAFFHFGLNLKKLVTWSKRNPRLKAESKAEFLGLIRGSGNLAA